jgi:hypothetical protein
LARFEFESETVRLFYLLPLVHLENHVCLSHGMQLAGAAWYAATRIVTEIGDWVQRTEDGRIGRILGGRAIEMSGNVVCGLHRARGDEEHEFLGWASKSRSIIFSGLASKPVATGYPVWAAKPSAPVWWSELRRFLNFGLKIKQTSAYRLHHKTDEWSTARDTCRDLTSCFVWKQVTLGFPSLALRLAEARRQMVHVAPSWRLRWDQVENRWVDATDGVGLCYPYFTVLYVLDNRSIVII